MNVILPGVRRVRVVVTAPVEAITEASAILVPKRIRISFAKSSVAPAAPSPRRGRPLLFTCAHADKSVRRRVARAVPLRALLSQWISRIRCAPAHGLRALWVPCAHGPHRPRRRRRRRLHDRATTTPACWWRAAARASSSTPRPPSPAPLGDLGERGGPLRRPRRRRPRAHPTCIGDHMGRPRAAPLLAALRHRRSAHSTAARRRSRASGRRAPRRMEVLMDASGALVAHARRLRRRSPARRGRRRRRPRGLLAADGAPSRPPRSASRTEERASATAPTPRGTVARRVARRGRPLPPRDQLRHPHRRWRSSPRCPRRPARGCGSSTPRPARPRRRPSPAPARATLQVV